MSFGDVPLGSNSEVELANADFRFTPESRHQADIAEGSRSADFVAKVS
jgi:hypothetical protein